MQQDLRGMKGDRGLVILLCLLNPKLKECFFDVMKHKNEAYRCERKYKKKWIEDDVTVWDLLLLKQCLFLGFFFC